MNEGKKCANVCKQQLMAITVALTKLLPKSPLTIAKFSETVFTDVSGGCKWSFSKTGPGVEKPDNAVYAALFLRPIHYFPETLAS